MQIWYTALVVSHYNTRPVSMTSVSGMALSVVDWPYSSLATDESDEWPWTFRCRNFSLRMLSMSMRSDSVLALVTAFNLTCGTKEDGSDVSLSTDLPATRSRRGIDVLRTWKLVNSAHANSSLTSVDPPSLLWKKPSDVYTHTHTYTVSHNKHSSYAWQSTGVCMEWDRYICRRCAGRARRRLVVVICVLLTVANSSFPATDSSASDSASFSPTLCAL